jgi:dihydroxyacetone kinase-like protein
VETVVGTDDVASMPAGAEAQRRGIAGIFFVYKTAGAKAEQRAPLVEVKRVAQKANARVRSMGVALSPCILPAVGRPSFTVGEGEMEIGMGIHGEPGIEHGRIESAASIAGKLIKAILADMPVPPGGRVAVLVNGLGATPLEELYVVYAAVHRLLVQQGISVHATYVGEYATSLEMCGLSVSLLSLDDELQQLLDAPFETPFHKQFQKAP